MFRAVRATAQRISTLTVASVVALSSLATAAPLFFSDTAEAAASVVTTNMSAWNTADTSIDGSGHFQIVANGLRVWTNASGHRKSVGYYQTNFALSSASDFYLDWTGTAAQPGGQLVVDLDNDGSNDGVLVIENLYGGISGKIWLPSLWNAAGINADLVSLIPHEPAAGSGGYPNQGALSSWAAAFPDAKVKAIGYSLGSGVTGDGVIKKITAGGTSYTFALPDTTAPKVYIKGAGNAHIPTSVGSFADGVYRTANFKLNDNKSLASWQINGGSLHPASGPWSDANNIAVGINGGVQGANTITVRDAAGNSTTLPFTLDNAGPTITVKPESLGSVSSNTFRNVSFKLYDANKVDYLTLNGVVKDLTNNNSSDLNSVGLHNWFGEHEGVNELVVYDVAGNSTTFVFTIDRVAPTGTFAYSNGNGNNVTNQDVTVTLTTNEAVQTPDGWTKATDTTFTKTFATNGKFNLTIADLAGNTRVVGGEVKRIDHINPVFVNVADGAYYSAPVQVIAHDQSLKDKLSVNGIPVQLINTQGWDWTTVSPLVNDGVYALIATDKGGNSTTITITIDTVAPTAPVITSPANDAEFASSVRQIVATWDASTDATSGVKGYEIEYSYIRDGVAVTDYRYTNDTFRVQQLSGNVLSDFTIRVRADDKAGNWSAWSAPVTYHYGMGDSEGGQGGEDEDNEEVVSTTTPPTGNEAGFVASRAVTNDGSRVLAANTANQTTGEVLAAETATDDKAVDGTVDEDEKKSAQDTSSVFDYWWIILLVLLGVFWFFAAKRRKNEE